MTNHASRNRGRYYGVWRTIGDPPRPHRSSRGKGFMQRIVTTGESGDRVTENISNFTARAREMFKHFLKSTRKDDDG